MSGIRNLLPQIPPILISQLAITNPTKALSTCRIYGSNDPQYGTVGWVPPQDQSAFAVISASAVSTSTPEPNRVWGKYDVEIFIGVSHADTAFAVENFNDEALAWMDQAIQVVAANRRLYPAGLPLGGPIGDVRWEMTGGGIRQQHPIYNIPYYGVVLNTKLTIVYGVSYQS